MKLRLECQNGRVETYAILVQELKIGYVTYTDDRHYRHIEALYLEPDYRKKGVGKQVVNELRNQTMILTGDANPLSIPFWKSMGATFEVEGIENHMDYCMDQGVFPPFFIQGWR